MRHELKTAEKAIAKLETVVAALRDELEVAGTDHEAIARVGTELAAQELALAAPRRPGSSVRPNSRRSTASADDVIPEGADGGSRFGGNAQRRGGVSLNHDRHRPH